MAGDDSGGWPPTSGWRDDEQRVTPSYGTPPPPGAGPAPTSGYPTVSSDAVSSYPVHDVRPYDATPAPAPVPYAPAPVPAQPWAAVAATDQVTPSTAGVVVAWTTAVLSWGYMLPFAIAMTRGKANRWGVFWVNLLLGWTAVGWVIALVWSCLPHRVLGYGAAPAGFAVPPGWYPTPDGRHAYWDGVRWTGHIS